MTSKKSRLISVDHRFVWIGLGFLTWLLKWVAGSNPGFTEWVYAQGFFQVVRLVWDYTLGWLPFPWLYLAVPGLIGWWVWRFIRANQTFKKLPIKNRIARWLLGTTTFFAGLFTLFYFLWGFNYFRMPIEQWLQLKVPIASELKLGKTLSSQISRTSSLEASIPDKNQGPLKMSHLPSDLEGHLRVHLEAVLEEMGYPTVGRVRAKRVWPQGALMQMGASGIYIPFVMEGHVDACIPPVSLPFTMAHEMSHGYGFGDEGTCNFLGYLACQHSPDPAIRYSGAMGYYRYLARSYMGANPEVYEALRQGLPAGMVADLDAVNAVIRRYPGWYPWLYAKIYDTYLEKQGISEGSENYDRILQLIPAWEHKMTQ
ncbi:DUF3810 domain-containing protein [Pontibacter sp. G13]|uniref:DUF3810 domain-containing protein n=1 Tax=Pontibacter sp. G13 TaxID=3074898 RepID=UPI00288C009C|nr:DUF3810 domain-containing protein [Pontibacter sp. G13]WNJ21498.1 DUF3810 domain-containing protein [Pontibacter sp. G13]